VVDAAHVVVVAVAVGGDAVDVVGGGDDDGVHIGALEELEVALGAVEDDGGLFLAFLAHGYC
jgi:hypothetical protein